MRPELIQLEQQQAGVKAERIAIETSNKSILKRTQECLDRIEVLHKTRKDYQDVLLSLFVDLLDYVVSNESTPILTSSLPDSHFKKHLESNQVVMISILPIKDASGSLITGFLSTEWCSYPKADEMVDNFVRSEMSEKCRYIEAELAKQNK